MYNIEKKIDTKTHVLTIKDTKLINLFMHCSMYHFGIISIATSRGIPAELGNIPRM